MARVFISYRRSDSRWAAGRLYDRLAEVLGRDNVFFDVSNIDPGDDFVSKIAEIVGACDVLLAVIGPTWLSVQDKSGRRRLDSPRDLIRVEVGAALKRKIRVIPILVDSAEMPEEPQLPEELAPLANRNAHGISFARFHTDLDGFIRVLERILAGPSGAAPTVQQVQEAQADSKSSKVVASELPFTIALTTLGGVASPLIAKGARLPAEASEVFSTAEDNQSSVEIDLCLGERRMAKDNVTVGKFQLSGIPPAPRGIPQIEIKAIVDPSLILTVTAEDRATHRKQVLDAVDLSRIEIPPGARDGDSEAPEVTESTRDSPVNLGKMAEGAKSSERTTDFSDLFKEFFGDSKFDFRKRKGGEDVAYDLALPFEDAVLGCQSTIEVSGKKLKVTIPGGVDTGVRLRLKGEGRPGQGGAEAGDLYVVLKVGEHAKYSRTGQDLHCTMPIAKVDAERGVTLTPPPLGTRPPPKFEVPAGTPAGTRFRLPGQGVPTVADAGKAGDLYVTLEIV